MMLLSELFWLLRVRVLIIRYNDVNDITDIVLGDLKRM